MNIPVNVLKEVLKHVEEDENMNVTGCTKIHRTLWAVYFRDEKHNKLCCYYVTVSDPPSVCDIRGI